jgi:hypothetical protein
MKSNANPAKKKTTKQPQAIEISKHQKEMATKVGNIVFEIIRKAVLKENWYENGIQIDTPKGPQSISFGWSGENERRPIAIFQAKNFPNLRQQIDLPPMPFNNHKVVIQNIKNLFYTQGLDKWFEEQLGYGVQNNPRKVSGQW